MYSFNKRRPAAEPSAEEPHPEEQSQSQEQQQQQQQQQQLYTSNNYYQNLAAQQEGYDTSATQTDATAVAPPPTTLAADLPVDEVLLHYRALVQSHAVAPPPHWRRIRFELPATIAELALDPPLPARVQYTPPIVPSPCLVLLLEGLRPAETPIGAYMQQMVQYLFELLTYNKAATAVTTLRFVKKGSEVQQMVVTFGHDVPLATLLLEQLQAAGIPAGFGPPIEDYPPNATFAVHDYRLALNDGKGISREQLLQLLRPFRQGSNQADIEVIEGYEPGVFYVPVKRPETIYSFLWNPFCSFTVQKELLDRYGVLLTMAQCPHDFLKKGIPYYLQRQEKERAKALRLANGNRDVAGDSTNADEDGVGVSTSNYFNNYGGKYDAYREDYKEDERDNHRSSNDEDDFEDEDSGSQDEDGVKNPYEQEQLMAEAEEEIDIFAPVPAPATPAGTHKVATPRSHGNSGRPQEQEWGGTAATADYTTPMQQQQQQVPSSAPGGSSYPALNDDDDDEDDNGGMSAGVLLNEDSTGVHMNGGSVLQMNVDSYAAEGKLPDGGSHFYAPLPRSRQQQQQQLQQQQQQPLSPSAAQGILNEQNSLYYPNNAADNSNNNNTTNSHHHYHHNANGPNETLVWNFTLNATKNNHTKSVTPVSGYEVLKTPPPPPPPLPPQESILGDLQPASSSSNFYASYPPPPPPNRIQHHDMSMAGGSLLPLPEYGSTAAPSSSHAGLLADVPAGATAYPFFGSNNNNNNYNHSYNNNNNNSNNYYSAAPFQPQPQPQQLGYMGGGSSDNNHPNPNRMRAGGSAGLLPSYAAAATAPILSQLTGEEAETLVRELEERVHHAFPTSVVPASLEANDATKEPQPRVITSLTSTVPVDAQVPAATIEINELLEFITAHKTTLLRLLRHPPRAHVGSKKATTTTTATSSTSATAATVEKDAKQQQQEEEEEALQAHKTLLMRCLLVQGSGEEREDWRPTAAGGHHVDSDAEGEDGSPQTDEGTKAQATQLPALLPYLLAHQTHLALLRGLLAATVLRSSSSSSTVPAAADPLLQLLARYVLPFLTDAAVGQQLLQPALRSFPSADNPLVARLLRHGGQLTQWLIQRGHVLAQQQARQRRGAVDTATETESEQAAARNETESVVMKHYISAVGNMMDLALAQLSRAQQSACHTQVNTDAELRRCCGVATDGEGETMVYLHPHKYRTPQEQQAKEAQEQVAAGTTTTTTTTALWGVHGALRRTLLRMFLSADVLSADRIFSWLFPPVPPTPPTREQLFFLVVATGRTQASPSLSVETASLCGHFLRHLEGSARPGAGVATTDDAPSSESATALGANEGTQVLQAALKTMQTAEAYAALRGSYFNGQPPRTDAEREAAKSGRFPLVFDTLAAETPPEEVQQLVHAGMQQALQNTFYYFNHNPSMDVLLRHQGQQQGPHQQLQLQQQQQQWQQQLPHWREGWTATMAQYPPTGEPYPALPEGWQGSRSRTYGHYYFKPPAGASLSPSYRHPVDRKDYIVTPQSFLAEATEQEAVQRSRGGPTLPLLHRVLDAANAKLAFYFCASGKEETHVLQYLRPSDGTFWANDQRVRNYYLDVAVLQLLGVSYRVGSSSANQHGHLQRARPAGAAAAGSGLESYHHKLRSIHNGYPAAGPPFPTLHKGWDINLSSSTGLYAFRPPRQGAEQTYWHPATRRPYRAAPQAFAQHRKLEAQAIADKSGKSLEEVKEWLQDQRRRSVALDAAVVELVPIQYCNFEDIKEEEEKKLQAEEQRRAKERDHREKRPRTEARDAPSPHHRHRDDEDRDRARRRERDEDRERGKRHRDDDYHDRRGDSSRRGGGGRRR